MTGRTVEDLQPGDVLACDNGAVLVLDEVHPPVTPDGPYRLVYEVLRWPDKR
jgi:hypothetical protein